jgi:hypothetical protein
MKSKFRDFESAREFARSLNLKGDKGWREYCKSGDKPDDIPVKPWNSYKEWFEYCKSGDKPDDIPVKPWNSYKEWKKK